MATNDPSIPRLKTAASLLAISAVTQVAILALALPLFLSENFLGVEGDGRKSIGGSAQIFILALFLTMGVVAGLVMMVKTSVGEAKRVWHSVLLAKPQNIVL
jgi:hypothetical protein